MSIVKDLTRQPGSPQMHRWADWAEIQCLTSADGYLSLSDLTEQADEQADFVTDQYYDAEPDSDLSDELDEEIRVRAEAYALENDEPGLDRSEGLQAQAMDATSRRINEVLNLVKSRAAAYGEAYPFEIASNGRGMKLRAHSRMRGLYLFLVLCASLQYVDKRTQSRLTSAYEQLCVELTRLALPAAKVELFGKNPDVTSDRYSGHITKKFDSLAVDLGERTIYDPSDFLPTDTGDHGLDVVAWIESGDGSHGKLAFFGQCACTPAWTVKQNSVKAAHWRSVLTLTSSPFPICFIPYDFRRADGKWHKISSIDDTYIIDRRRAIAALRDARGQIARRTVAAISSLDELPRSPRIALDWLFGLVTTFGWRDDPSRAVAPGFYVNDFIQPATK